MPIDIELVKQNPQLVIESQQKRFKPKEQVDQLLEVYEQFRNARHTQELTQAEYKKVDKEIQLKRRAKENADDLIAKKKDLEEQVSALEKQKLEIQKRLDQLHHLIGNILHESVPVGQDEDTGNQVVRTWGECKKPAILRNHHDLLYMIDGYDAPRGSKVAGHRAYFLKGVGVQLNFALINYGLAFLSRKGYTPLQTPFLMNKNMMSKTAELDSFDEDLYKVNCESSKDVDVVPEEREKYLIATSEQPISAFHQGEFIDVKSLPIKYAGISTCFRKEAGAYGKDTWGIFRVHQFEKVEQFVITAPDKSWEMHEEMVKISEEFFQSLGIPYRVIAIVSAALNNAAAKKYDIEGWFPGYDSYRELVSCSNCTDFQSRALEVRYGMPGTKEKKFVHMLNGTLCATTRGICAILENYQTETGIVVPEVLRPFMGGLEFIPFVNAPQKKKENPDKGDKSNKQKN